MKSGGFCNNLRVFLHSKPPVVLFTLTLAFVALLSVTVSVYIKNVNLKAGDVTKDWNVYLESVSGFEFCVQLEQHNKNNPTTTASTLLSSPSLSPLPKKLVKNYTVPMMITILPTIDFINIPHNLTLLSGLVDPVQLGFKDATHEDGMVEVLLEIPYEWNSTKCSGLLRSGCDAVKVYACITIRASLTTFPSSLNFPKPCEPSINSSDYSLEYQAKMVSYKPFSYQKVKCQSGPIVKLQHSLDPALTVYLSLANKSLINLHLLHTSFFLFVMVLMIFIIALFKGRGSRSSYDNNANNKNNNASSIILVHGNDDNKIVPLLTDTEL